MHARVEVTDMSQVGEARRLAVQVGEAVHLDDEEVGRLGIIATEAASNLIKHGGGGEILVASSNGGARRGVEIVALDRGRGMADLARSMTDGVSSLGTQGGGLGALRRLSSELEIYTNPDHGTALLARVWEDRAAATKPHALRLGGICVAKPGQDVSGDAWASINTANLCAVLVADGLGHGPGAAAASEEAVRLFREDPTCAPADCIEKIHRGLKPTRGAAVAVAHLDRASRVVRYAGLGNITAMVLSDDTTTNLVSHHGTAGHEARKIGEFRYPWPTSGVLVMFSDGLGTHWNLSTYAGLRQRDPSLVAAVLYRDHARGRDDPTVVVVREDE
jgi:anti-sigma regulatory factor (Ser/Thr protein kinase)